ncbi:TrbI/VirB10 family protein [Pseudodesulfovibrio senegalensis]|uniref:TrbI/VirB10 family protein n=1 Tax=Pseudodesulfovibrio senegalensis TaxID=1721087 RepID=A0A6N6N098_9BACT|nr:TrbI/VirB10 family protein [Pseudodesulfovibrio senegalensis]KAB1437304.1 TrbI/VirB10 family protein [Pseudodesulfovibrio senegalensis]
MTNAPTEIPKLRPASFGREFKIWAIIATVILGGSLGGAWAYREYYKPSQQIEDAAFIQDGTIDPIFNGSFLPEEKPKEIKLPPIPEIKTPAPILPPKKEIPPPSADDLFALVKPDRSIAQKRAAINAARQGKVSVRASHDLYGTEEKTDYVMTQRDFPDEGKTITSYPVNLERVLTADMFIPALLVNEIKSDLAGKVIARVERDIYSTHGRNILIPAGTSAVGYYEPLTKVGESRVKIIWVRMITPDGINIHTANAELADAMGRSGITGDVDNHYLEKYGLPLLMSTLQMIAAHTFPVKDQTSAAAIETYGTSVSNMGAKILDEHMKINPSVTISRGSRIQISIMKDIWFPEPFKRTVRAKAVMEDS